MEDRARNRAEIYWADRLACSPQELRTPGLHFVDAIHPERVFVVAVGPSTLVAATPDLRRTLAQLDPLRLCDPAVLSEGLPAGAILVGPAFVGYSLSFPAPEPDLVEFPTVGDPRFAELRASLPAEAWRHANLEAATRIYGVVRNGCVVAASGAQLLRGGVAHIGVATHPHHRGQGLARAVVSAVGFAASGAGLLPQYQTLYSNTAAMQIARTLGFEEFAVTLSARWGSAAA